MAPDLRRYRSKRDFAATPEPSPSPAARDDGEPEPRFVVHEHHARRLHWDLRLERDGALASWAVPNGIPEDPKRNRKAIHVEDHPLEYLEFAGTIPPGEYGAGEISIWDRGTYSCEKWRADEVMFVAHGERLRGRYVLFRTGDGDKDWMLHRMDPPLDEAAQRDPPERIEPMLARSGSLPRSPERWGFEVKWDGVRALARSLPGRLRIVARSGNDITAAYPELRGLNAALSSHGAILDGEIVAFDDRGRPSFAALQTRMHARGAQVRGLAERRPVTYMVFDLLWLDGHSLLDEPYSKRREHLDALGLAGAHWQVSPYYAGEGEGLLAATAEQGLEGVVAKRLDSPYRPGRRSPSWIKIKNARRQELVIGAYLPGKGARAGAIGSLQLGVHDERGRLLYAGGVGSGFGEDALELLRTSLEPLRRARSPFSGRQPPKGSVFVEPELVCEVRFSDWTEDGSIRHAVFLGLRDDADPERVVREPAGAPDARDGALTPKLPARGGAEIEVDGRELRVTNLDKVLYPSCGFTKGQVIEYYARIAPLLVAHARDHPMTLKRYPDGVDAKPFFEKRANPHRPDWVATAAVPSGSRARDIDYVLVQDRPTLVWAANLAALELHPSLSTAAQLDVPRSLVFDLDPGPGAGIVECCRVGLAIRELLSELDLLALAKTSGSKGLQLYVPLNGEIGYEQTKTFAHAVAALLAQREPERVVARMSKNLRAGKVLIDYSQNDAHKTTVAAYSLRARERPTVSTPVDWDEVGRCARGGDPESLVFTAEDVLRRVERDGDLFAPLLDTVQELPDLSA